MVLALKLKDGIAGMAESGDIHVICNVENRNMTSSVRNTGLHVEASDVVLQ